MTAPAAALVLTPKAHGADGISAVTRLTARSLERAGITARVLTLAVETRRDLADGEMTTPLESADGRRMRFVLKGLKAAANEPDVVIATHLRMLPAAVPLMARGVPVVTFLLGIECWRPLTLRDRRLVATSRLLLPISRWTRERFLEANPSFADTPMSLCPPGINADGGGVAGTVHGRVVVVGRLWSEERYKGHDLLIDVWPAVRQACPAASLVMVGDGDDRRRLEKRVRDAGLAAAIQFTGIVSQAELRTHLATAQVFVLPSAGEGFGIVFLEAMRAARPCIAARGAAEEVVTDGVTGRIVPVGDRHALAAALIELLSDPARCDAFGRAGRMRFEAEFTEARFAERFIPAVREACAC